MIRALDLFQILINMEVLIVDFDDSFTFNLAEICHRCKLSHEVIPYSDLSIQKVLSLNPMSVVWGPGPGHPDEYIKAKEIIKDLFDIKSIFQLGVCLGHQLLLQVQGFKIIDAPEKLHGRSSMLLVPPWPEFDPSFHNKETEVQYYSSLAVSDCRGSFVGGELLTNNGLVLVGKGEGFLSYQFHPESVGTSCPDVFIYGWLKQLIQ